MTVFGESLPEDDSTRGDRGDWLPEHDGDLTTELSAVASLDTGRVMRLTRPDWVFHDANSQDPDVHIPVPEHKFTDI